MVTLGLLPPYTLEDIRAAYREKAKTLHPDRGGTPADFEIALCLGRECRRFGARINLGLRPGDGLRIPGRALTGRALLRRRASELLGVRPSQAGEHTGR